MVSTAPGPDAAEPGLGRAARALPGSANPVARGWGSGGPGRATSLVLFATMPGIVAIMSPLAGELAAATQFPVITVLMTIVNGYTLVVFPYQAGPIVFALMLGGARFRDAVRLMLPLLVISAVILIPLTYLWWRFLGYLG